MDIESRLYEIRAKVSRLRTVAWVATVAFIKPESCKRILNDVLRTIEDMSDQISEELDSLVITMQKQQEMQEMQEKQPYQP